MLLETGLTWTDLVLIGPKLETGLMQVVPVAPHLFVLLLSTYAGGFDHFSVRRVSHVPDDHCWMNYDPDCHPDCRCVPCCRFAHCLSLSISVSVLVFWQQVCCACSSAQTWSAPGPLSLRARSSARSAARSGKACPSHLDPPVKLHCQWPRLDRYARYGEYSLQPPSAGQS